MHTTAPAFSENGPAATSLAVLTSGGLDSAILLSESSHDHRAVYPLYVRSGLAWESAELEHLAQFLEVMRCPSLRPLHILDVPVADLYGAHWSLTGRGVPDQHAPDEAVFLPGRNVLLLSKAMLWCHLSSVPVLALALLGSNPFGDATPSFFAAFEQAVNEAVGGTVHVQRPYAGLSKTQVIYRGKGLPLELTFSCIHPVAGRHCGQCNKCGERRRAFAQARLADPTLYAAEAPCTG